MRFLSLLLSGAIAATTTTVLADYVPGKAFDRFITIWLENQDDDKADLEPHLAALKKQGILLAEYYGLTHPSQPNYIASVAGDYFGLNNDGYIRIPENISTIVDIFDDAGIEWRGYFEDVPGPGFMGEGSNANWNSEGPWDYVRKHNPFVAFDSINLNGTRLLNLQSLADFQHAVSSNTLPQYMHISPNMRNDGHDTSLSFSGTWLSGFLAPLLSNPTFMNRTLILLTYDESETYSIPNRIFSLLLGGAVPTSRHGEVEDTIYNHYSILSTLQSNWDLPNLGRYDVGANVFSLVAEQTGYKNVEIEDTYINNSLSYAGFLNTEAGKWKEIPVPNLQLVGAGGKGVSEAVKRNWETMGEQMTPYDGSGKFFDGGDGETNPDAPVYGPQVSNVESPAES